MSAHRRAKQSLRRKDLERAKRRAWERIYDVPSARPDVEPHLDQGSEPAEEEAE